MLILCCYQFDTSFYFASWLERKVVGDENGTARMSHVSKARVFTQIKVDFKLQ